MEMDMSEVGFTRGPWISVVGNTSGREVLAEKPSTKTRRRVARIGGPDRNANAHLIAAAPDLYEALSELVEELSASLINITSVVGDSREITKARAALAKARGETP